MTAPCLQQNVYVHVCVCADDPQADKLLLVMEYAEAGPVMRGDRSTEKVPLAEGVALKFLRDVLQVLLPASLSIEKYHELGTKLALYCTS